VERVSSYDEIDHYRPKSHYYWLGYSWENLLISCKPCNTKKGDNFPLRDESRRATTHDDDLSAEKPLLIDPYIDEPSEHLYWRGALVTHHTDRGEATIQILDLNRDELYRTRDEYLRGQRAIRACLEALRLLEPYAEKASEHMRTLDRSIMPNSKYSAMMLASLGSPR
jgi:uncharacterized protein (TIGR02646 family)